MNGISMNTNYTSYFPYSGGTMPNNFNDPGKMPAFGAIKNGDDSEKAFSTNAARGSDKSEKNDAFGVKRKSSPEECQTCKERKYQDGSNENVSFKSASHEDYHNATILIRNSLLQMWRLTKDELMNIAMENLKNSQMEFCSLMEKLAELISSRGMAGPEAENVCTPVYIATNLSNHYGASVIMDDEKLKQIAWLVKDDFYIIPSSVHEVLCIPISAIPDGDFLEQMLSEINQTQVEPEEVLEWHIYRYHVETKEITCP